VTEGRDFDAGVKAGEEWAKHQAADLLSREQLHALPLNLERMDRLEGERYANQEAGLHIDEAEDPAADAYAALTGDFDFTSRATVREFWGRILPGELDGYGEDFFAGFLLGVERVVS
jgi:hypothetical protein